MESNYYTPTIEEFHVGFECEWRRFEEDWHGGKINSSIELYDAAIEYEAGENQTYEYRVKYLDKEDIESLGWVIDKKLCVEDGILPYFVFNKGSHELSFFCYKDLNKRLLRIYKIKKDDLDLESSRHLRFSGTIKNKSELKVLLKQLGIE